ncbi:hypothetical protein ACEPAG_6547 [Sanghuangporus baumii]
MDSVTVVRHLFAIKLYGTGSFAIGLYEYAITLDREIEAFWKRRLTFATVLWFLNRYILLFSTFPTVVGFHYPYSDEQCSRFVRFPGSMQIASNVASGLTLSLRVYALYGQAWWVIAVLLPVFLAEIGLEIWAVAGGVAASLPPGIIGCILTGRPDEGDRFAAFWIGQLVFPTLIFVMTFIRVIRLRRYGTLKGSLLTLILRDGICYFFVIFIANLTNVLTYTLTSLLLKESLKFANAPFTNVITTLMICRLMLNLRRPEPSEITLTGFSQFRAYREAHLGRTYLGDLGAEMDIDNLNDHTRKQDAKRIDPRRADVWIQSEEETELELDTMSHR